MPTTAPTDNPSLAGADGGGGDPGGDGGGGGGGGGERHTRGEDVRPPCDGDGWMAPVPPAPPLAPPATQTERGETAARSLS